MLCAKVDKDLTQLQGRWKSDAMIWYLHVSASPEVETFAQRMFKAGNFSFFPQLHTHYQGYAYTDDDPVEDDLEHNDAPADLIDEDIPLEIESDHELESDPEPDDDSNPGSHDSQPNSPPTNSPSPRSPSRSPQYSSPDDSLDFFQPSATNTILAQVLAQNSSSSDNTTRRSNPSQLSLFSESYDTPDDPLDRTWQPDDSDS